MVIPMKRESRERDQAILNRAIVKLALAAVKVGVTPDGLIELLNSGMTVAQLLDYINNACAQALNSPADARGQPTPVLRISNSLITLFRKGSSLRYRG